MQYIGLKYTEIAERFEMRSTEETRVMKFSSPFTPGNIDDAEEVGYVHTER